MNTHGVCISEEFPKYTNTKRFPPVLLFILSKKPFFTLDKRRPIRYDNHIRCKGF